MPDTVTADGIRWFQFAQVEQGAQPPKMNGQASALRLAICIDGGRAALSLVPGRLWIIGLNHLGQAYLWAFGLLPFSCPQDPSLILQNMDIVTP